MKGIVEERAIELGEYIIESKATVRKAAKKFGVSKSTVHKDVAERLKYVDPQLYKRVKTVLEINKAQRHIRGGLATKQKYSAERLTARKSLRGGSPQKKAFRDSKGVFGAFLALLGSYKHNPPFPAQPPSIYGRRGLLCAGAFLGAAEAERSHRQQNQERGGLRAGHRQPHAGRARTPRQQQHRRDHRRGAS